MLMIMSKLLVFVRKRKEGERERVLTQSVQWHHLVAKS